MRPLKAIAIVTTLFALTGVARVSVAQSTPKSTPKPTPAAPHAKSKAVSKTPTTRGLLFRVESTTATVYVLGSIHVANEALYPLDSRITSAFDQADTLVLETELTPTAKARGAKLMQQAGTYAPPDSLDAHLDERTRAALHGALAERGVPSELVQVMRPWLVSLTLTLLQLNAIGYKPELGIDEHFRSKAARKHLASIETVEQQVGVFRDMQEAVQHAALRQTLEELPNLGALMGQAVDAWRRGDARALDSLLLLPMRKDFPKLYERLFVDRNKRMADAIDQHLEGNSTVFVVIGSGHLVGPDSVLHFLKRRGHAPSQM
jgi:uncharacterized protein YbaP (TraB family)